MARIRFSGEYYRSVKFIAPGPGEYEVDEDRAAYLTSTFPEQWTRVEEPQPADPKEKSAGKPADKGARAAKKADGQGAEAPQD